MPVDCLDAGGLTLGDVDAVTPTALVRTVSAVSGGTRFEQKQFEQVLSPDVQRRNLEQFFPGTDWPGKLVPVEHHLAHAASAFYTSGFRDALILISDGMGKIHSMTVRGSGRRYAVTAPVPALHSLGILYGVFTLYLGFAFGVDEYKVMGLAPYGNPAQFYQMADLATFETTELTHSDFCQQPD